MITLEVTHHSDQSQQGSERATRLLFNSYTPFLVKEKSHCKGGKETFRTNLYKGFENFSKGNYCWQAAMARGIGTLKPPQMQHSGNVVLISLVFRICFYLHQFLFLTLVLTPTNY